jgi:hypothetical protein
LFNLRYDITPDYKLEAFAYLLDFGNSAINSSATRGVKGSGKNEVGPVKLAYETTYAHQSDYANAPAPFDLDFYAADLPRALMRNMLPLSLASSPKSRQSYHLKRQHLSPWQHRRLGKPYSRMAASPRDKLS